MKSNEVWDLVDLHKGAKAIGVNGSIRLKGTP